MPQLYLPAAALILSITLLVIYYAKKRVTLLENKMYVTMLFAILVDSFLVTALFFNSYTNYNELLVKILNKIDYSFLIIWSTALFLYVYVITYDKKPKFEENFKLVSKIICLVDFIMFIIVWISKVDIIRIDALKQTAQGMSVTLAITFCLIIFMAAFVIVILNLKKLNKKYVPVFVILFLTVFIAFLFSFNPYLICISMGLTLVNLIMYFTIENPDLQLIQELLRNKEVVQNSIEDKSKFLFKMSQDIRNPISSIQKYIADFKQEKNKDLKKELFDLIEKNVNDISYMINDILDISKMDLKNIKIYNTTYETDRFFEDIKKKAENLIGDKNIKVNMNVGNNIPKILYGDYIKLKQVLIAIINNSVKYTNEGYIDIDVNPLVRYDVCRLIINITDTGIGMNLNIVNEILGQTGELTKEEEKALNGLDINLKTIKKILRLLGGSLNIKSEEGKGTVISIYVDQKSGNTEEAYYNKNVKKYNEQMDKRNRILLVNDNTEEIDSLEKELLKYKVVVNTSMFSNDCINKINTGEKYHLIIIKDDMKEEEALPILNKLKKIKKFDIPVIVLLNKNKASIKKHYLEDGFKDYIIKENLKTDIKRICEKYL